MWGSTFSNTKKKAWQYFTQFLKKNQKSKGGFASYNPITCTHTLQSLTKEKEKE
jgi:hypothetical protein